MNFHFEIPSLKMLYSKPYDEKMMEWRRLSAIDKALNISVILSKKSAKPQKILEVGCGTGAVLEELAKTKIGNELYGIEIGLERSKVKALKVDGVAIHIRGYDGTTIPYEDKTFDLVYATHVLEHVCCERDFLYELSRVSKGLVYIEVPLEEHIRTNFSSLQRTLNIGHINTYSLYSFILRLETCGLSVEEFDIFDQSYNCYKFAYSYVQSIIHYTMRNSVLKIFGKKAATKIFTYHAGALCTLGVKPDICNGKN